MKNFVKFGIATVSITPLLALANVIDTTVTNLQTAITNIPALVIGLAVIYFLIGVWQYASGGDEKTRGDAKIKIVYGLIALFVMVAVWGLIAEIGSITGVSTGTGAPAYPSI
ncbi:MAG: hypothetical protein HZA94_00740 [Candidatus Vogelbacteria bacterium]|nr:hypothetical protein [Candidatus Vogelbacteria bacterium]